MFSVNKRKIMQIQSYKKEITDIISFEALPFVLYSTDKRTPAPVQIWYPVFLRPSQSAPDRLVLTQKLPEVENTVFFSFL